MKSKLYAITPKAGKAVKATRVRKTGKPAPFVFVPPVSVNPYYTPRDVTHEDRATLRGGVYFVQLVKGGDWTIARFKRDEGFRVHLDFVQPLHVWTCDKADFDVTYRNASTDCLEAVQANPFARPYL